MSGNRDLRARFIEHCSTNRVFAGRPRVLAAVSGGADSVVLLRLLVDCSNALGIRVAAAHVNHLIRAEASCDAEFVKRLALGAGVPFLYAEADVPALAAARCESLEAAGRSARYAELARLVTVAGADVIATGHTMTDQAETLLMRMIRGTGPLGLAGIAESTDSGVVRPMLCLTAAEVRDFAAAEHIEYVQDASNGDESFLRNRIRARLLPLLADMNPRIEARLSELAADAAGLSAVIGAAAEPHVASTPSGGYLVRSDAPRAILPYAVRLAFERVTGEPLGLSRTHIDALCGAVERDRGPAEFHLPRRVVVHLRPEGLLFSRDLEGPPPGSARRRTH